MLDAETKARIDSARDILVGKVPDPKSQVEQITIALIYKFMDDMDRQSEELGGKASFFTGEFKKYRWGHLLDKRLGGHERLLLYAEGIEKMNENASIPQLFRDIFKGVFLPYRDPETLNLFLKEINGFSYDHSERLGDAYEYLLNILGTQGDAGQFRTPRHIIDFIVAVVNPQKHETVLDPACGTAGFLISAFKHILKANEDLSPDDRGRLMTNFAGYDIAPDMVRLSRVNMYLHGFPNPTIHEYDTLTSEERWDDRHDIIMTNPPFMTPKGGVRPHNRFAVKAKRSEVLFVDYIAEHLNLGGRAGIIVPEGIIFQSQNAYKNLRRMLVENYLWAVVSLPAGVFNPYSGVKTSILFLDKNMAKRTNDILFVKVANDGFDLGAQRRPIEGSELPEGLKILRNYRIAQEAQDGKMGLTVSRERLLETTDCNLSGDSYRAVAMRGNGQWPMAKLGDVCDVLNGYAFKSNNYCPNGIRVIRITNVQRGYIKDDAPKFYPLDSPEPIADFMLREDDLLISLTGNVGRVGLLPKELLPAALNQRVACLRTKDPQRIAIPFLFHLLNDERCEKDCMDNSKGMAQKNMSTVWLSQYEIPLPPMEDQERIVAELDGYRKVIEGARQVVENYKPTIRIDPEWEIVKLGQVIGINEETIDPSSKYGKEDFIYIDITSVGNGTGVVSFDNNISGNEAPSRARRKVKSGDVLLSTVRPNLKAFAFLNDVPENVIASTGFAVLSVKDRAVPQFIYYQLFGNDLQNQMIGRMGRGAYPSINQKDVQELKIPLPSLEIQQEIVAELEAERKMVESNRKLIEIFEKKIQAKLAEVWGETKD